VTQLLSKPAEQSVGGLPGYSGEGQRVAALGGRGGLGAWIARKSATRNSKAKFSGSHPPWIRKTVATRHVLHPDGYGPFAPQLAAVHNEGDAQALETRLP
jgi:hypothetical protein